MIHKQAAINTAIMLAVGLMAVIGSLFLIKFLTVEAFVYLLSASAFVYLIYIFYTIEKNRLESLDRLKKL